MSWFFTIFLLLCSSINSLEANLHHRKNLPSAVVVGTVYCDTCFQDDFSKSSHFIPGATVAVECKDDKSKPGFRQEAKTDEHGEFKVHLPFSVSKHVRRIKRCSVRLIKSSQPNCAVASSATSSSLNLKSRKPGTHVFSAGFFTFKPLNQPNQCNQKPNRNRDSKQASFPPIDNNNPNFPPPIQDPNPSTPIIPDLPPVGQNPLPPVPLLPNLPPLPQLPPLPPLPTLPNLPPMPGKRTASKKPEQAKASREKETSEDKAANPQFIFPPFLPPNPLTPAPVLPPNPLMPPLLPPNPLIPPPLLPPNPLMPPPLLPPNPLIPPPVLPPNPLMPPPLLPPNPLIPPPLLPPNPLMPPPLLPPNPLQPPPSPLIPLPPVPGINPSPPPAPTLPVPLPPLLPTPSTPPFPGIPPADTTTTSQKKPSP